jgi:crooked neck
MEIRHRQFNYAFNILERAVTILPRCDEFWLKYAVLNESLGNIEGSREIFQRWIAWEPAPEAFLAFVEFEARLGEFRRSRSIFERLLMVHPFEASFLRYADFEIKLRQSGRARRIFERALESLGVMELLVLRFAQFEEQESEIERARCLYQLALKNLGEAGARELLSSYHQFEKRFGSETEIESAIIEKKRLEYQQLLEANPLRYDLWFELCQLLQTSATIEMTREAFQRGVGNLPDRHGEKADWSPYALLCIAFATFEETAAKDVDRARKIYIDLIGAIPHKRFTISRVWVLYAHFEIRQDNLGTARKSLGHAIGTCPRAGIFAAYIEIETLLRNDDRIRALFEKYVETIPNDIRGWVKFAEFESRHGNFDAARRIFESAIESNAVDSIDLLWSVYIDFESKVGNVDNIRELYRRGIQQSNDVELWKGWIMLEGEVCGDVDASRRLFAEADFAFAEKREIRKELRDYRVLFEMEFGSDESVIDARGNVGRINEADGTIIFPEEDESSVVNLLAAADMWAAEKPH